MTSKKKDQVARIGVMGGGVRGFGQCPKEKVFLPLTPSLKVLNVKVVNAWAHCAFGNILIVSAPGLDSEPETQCKTCGIVVEVFKTLQEALPKV